MVIHRVTRVVNFAQGTFAVVGGLCAASFLGAGLPHGLGEAAAVGVAGLVGLAVGAIAIGKPGLSPLSSLVITLGLAIFAYAVELLIWGEQPVSFAGVPGVVILAGARIQWQYLVIIAAAGLTFAALALFFGRTDLGKALTACASNPKAARIVGIQVTRMGLLAFALGGVLGGLAGVLLTPLQDVTHDADVALAINGFAAAILGQLSRPLPALVGGLFLGVAESMVAGYLTGAYQTEVALVVMLAVMVWRASRSRTMREDT